MKKLIVLFTFFIFNATNICLAVGNCIIPDQCQDDSDCLDGKVCKSVWNNQAACNYKKCLPKNAYITY